MVGELVMGRFRVVERIGSGGMGTVYCAFDERLQRQVAIKEIPGGNAVRVTREAHAAARLNHPGIVTLYELGTQGNRALLVSELVHGETLAVLAQRGDLTDREVAEFGADLCGALEHAHERGVVHRDIKPHNVIVRADDGGPQRAKLMDFGIAAVAGAPTLTATGEVVGTLAYMAPEQAEGLVAGEAADVYSLALTLYECWTGINPVARETPAKTALEIGSRLPSLGEYRPDLPPRLLECVDACLEPDPDERPPVDVLQRRLEAAVPAMDGVLAVPAADPGERLEESMAGLRVIQLAALCAWGLTMVAIAAGAGRPGLALVLGLLSLPAIVATTWLPWAALPALAPLLGVLSAAPIYPAIAGARGRALEQGVLGALGWFWLLAGAATLGLGSRLGLIHSPAHGWSRSTGGAAHAILAPLLAPDALLGAVVFGLSAVVLGFVLRASHVAVALLGALLWSAGTAGALELVGGGRLAGKGILIGAAALAVVIVEFRLRQPRVEPHSAPSAHAARLPEGNPQGVVESLTT